MNKKVYITVVGIVSLLALSISLSVSAEEKAKKSWGDVQKERRWDQQACSNPQGQVASADMGKFMKMQKDEIKYPEGNAYSGDAEKGEVLFKDRPKKGGGNCVACHCQSAPGKDEKFACGTVGPNLHGFAKRGMDAKWAYDKVYNGWSITPCSIMPRFGIHGMLDPEKVSHIVAYLLDKNSALNK